MRESITDSLQAMNEETEAAIAKVEGVDEAIERAHTAAADAETAANCVLELSQGLDEAIEKVGTVVVQLTKYAHVFAADKTAALGERIEIGVVAYKEGVQIPATIELIEGRPAGITTEISGNGTTNAKLVITATSALVDQSGGFAINITADGKSFRQIFSYALALKGATGSIDTDGTVTYTTPTTYTAPASGLSLSVIFGRITKGLSDIFVKLTSHDTSITTLNSDLSNKQNKLLKGTATAADYNDITTPGWYWINPSTTTANQPISGYGILEVAEVSTSSRLQRFTSYSTGVIYSRSYTNAQWYDWRCGAGSATKTLLAITDITTTGECALTESYKNYAWITIKLTLYASSVSNLADYITIPSSILSSSKNQIAKRIGYSDAHSAYLQCGFPGDTTFSWQSIVLTSASDKVFATLYGAN